MSHDRTVRPPSQWTEITFRVVGLLTTAIVLLALGSVFSAIRISAPLTLVFGAFIVATDYALAKREQSGADG